MTPMPHFRSSTGEAAYRAAYQRSLALWPDGHETCMVATSFGATHVICLGPKTAPPLVMMHGFGFSGVQWYPNAPALARSFRVYAPDVPDQLGLSELEKPLQTHENYAAWMSELLDGLGIEKTPLIGHSYGGWLSANFAIHCPQRVTRLTLISPAATFVPLSLQFYLRGILGGASGNSWLIYNMVEWMTTLRPVRGVEIVEQFKIGMQNMAQLPPGFPDVYSAEQLRNLAAPVQLIIGDHEVIYNRKLRQMVEAARKVLPDIEVAWIENGGHAVTLDQPSAVNEQLLRFHCG